MEPLFSGQPFTTTDALAAGVSRRELARLRSTGVLRPVLFGVYVDARSPDDPSTRAAALARVLPAGAVVCRRSAAWLYGVDGLEPGREHDLPQLDAAVPVGHSPVRRAGVHGVVEPLTETDVAVVGGIPVTTPLRTAVDLARWLPRRSAMACVDALLHHGLVGLDELITGVERFAGHRYVEQARNLIGLAEPKTESFGESWLRLRLIDSGFPALEAQIEVREPDGLPFARIDLGERRLRKGIEYDGEQAHCGAAERAHDTARRARLARDFGWEVVGVDKAAVLGRGPGLESLAAELLGVSPQPRCIPKEPPAPDGWAGAADTGAWRADRGR